MDGLKRRSPAGQGEGFGSEHADGHRRAKDNRNREAAQTPVKRTRPLKRNRITEADKALLDQQLIDILQQDNPQSVRHMFYRMTDPRLRYHVQKTDSGTNNGYGKVQRRLVALRREGRIPYSWITDMSRSGYFVDTFASAADFIRRQAGLYRADLWADCDYHIEVWVESRSIASILLDLCQEMAVSLYPCSGFTSISFVHAASEYLNYVIDCGKQPVVLYFGDYDPSGVLISDALRAEYKRHVKGEIIFDRLGVNEEQILQYDLPTKPRKKKDNRAQQVKETVEAEAMPAGIVRELTRQRIEAYLPEHALDVVRTAEESEREFLLNLANQLAWR